MVLPVYRFFVRLAFAELLGAGKGGGSFGFRFNRDPRTRCALRLGEGPCALGFSILVQVGERLSISLNG
jgi:hypothetical protein